MEWINIKDGVPEKSGEVLCCMSETLSLYICYYKKQRNIFEVYGLGRIQPITDMKVEYWRQLPNPPSPPTKPNV